MNLDGGNRQAGITKEFRAQPFAGSVERHRWCMVGSPACRNAHCTTRAICGEDTDWQLRLILAI